MNVHDTSRSDASAAGGSEAPGRLDVVSDTICPWCYVGKRRLAAALRLLAAEGLAFEVTWRPFQLNPSMPAAGLERRAYRTAKFGSWAASRALDEQVAAAGAVEGVTFRHDLMALTPNTLASHRLIRLAHEVGGAALQDRVVEAVFAAYFTRGRDVGDPAVLADVGHEAGLGRARAADYLASTAGVAAVAEDEAGARDLGLGGVPSVLLDGRYVFSGAQPTQVIVRALREASAATAPARPAAAARRGGSRVLP